MHAMRSAVLLLAALGVTGCGNANTDGPQGDTTPREQLSETLPSNLSPGNIGGQDEDPAILKAADGALYVAWYSDRNGTRPTGELAREVFLMRSMDGSTWSDPPIQLSSNTGDERAFYPTLAQGPDGTIHAAWWKVVPLMGGGTSNRIVYKSSSDGSDWSAPEQEVAAGPGDFLPSIAVDAAGTVYLYFAAIVRDDTGMTDFGQTTLRVWVVVRQGGVWGAPALVQGVNDAAFHNTYPYVRYTDGRFVMTWTRYDAASGNDPLTVIGEASTRTMYATSLDGTTWTGPVTLSNVAAGAIEVFPSLFATGGAWYGLWLSTEPLPTGRHVELVPGAPYASLRERPELTGYSARMCETATPGIFWAVWVEGTNPTQKIRHRFFRR